MTPEECALRDAFLSEMWPTVHQYDPTHSPRKAPKASAPKKPRPAPSSPREECPLCGVDFLSAYMLEHILRRHPESVQAPSNDGETGAA